MEIPVAPDRWGGENWSPKGVAGSTGKTVESSPATKDSGNG
jgi:hypothetical protein